MTQPATTTPPASPTKSPSPKQPEHPSSVKETLESILVAFILAFIFRAFIVEAFVIPTGSMGPTLLGAHMRFTCNDCGYDFATNYTAQQQGEDLIIPRFAAGTYHIYCPNCGYKFPLVDDRGNTHNDATQPPIHYGDRILVLKYLYLFEQPQRWDIVVFKSPAPESTGPPTYRQNYIKRLIGKPGENVMILDGDIYVGRPGEELTDYEIQTKPRHAQEALWRVIYDNDYYPHGKRREYGAWRQPWTVRDGTGWNLGDNPTEGRTFRFENPTGESTIFFDRNANPTHRAFSNWLGYNVTDSQRDEQMDPRHPVRDLKVAFFYERHAGDGPLRIHLSDGRTTFAAILTPADATLVHLADDGEHVIGAAKLPRADKPLRVELANADYQVTLRINDQEIARTTPQQYRPDIAVLLEADARDKQLKPWPGVEIQAAQQTASISHLGLWRDLYYINDMGNILFGTPRDPIQLGPDEYFVLGDNSQASFDARMWKYDIDLPADELLVKAGRVPGRFLLGRAFFVYWPAGFRPVPLVPALAPDFGDMRFIR